jgi:hypothetical protein
VTREQSEDAGRAELCEAFGAALGDRRRYSSAFAHGTVEARNDAARTVLNAMRRHIDPTTLLVRAYRGA